MARHSEEYVKQILGLDSSDDEDSGTQSRSERTSMTIKSEVVVLHETSQSDSEQRDDDNDEIVKDEPPAKKCRLDDEYRKNAPKVVLSKHGALVAIEEVLQSDADGEEKLEKIEKIFGDLNDLKDSTYIQLNV